MAISKEQREEIITLKLEDEQERLEGGKGSSNATIALAVLGKRTKESTVRRVYKDYKNAVDSDLSVEDDQQLTGETLNALCESPQWELSNLAKRLRAAQRSNTQLRKIHREMFDMEDEVAPKTLCDLLGDVKNTINKSTPVIMRKIRERGKHITAEILISDIQYGKLMHGYNTKVAVARVKEYTKRIIERIEDYISKGYAFDKIKLIILGDVVESDKKHFNSARACDSGTAEQIKTGIENLFLDLIEPLALLGIPMEVISITGNHDHDDHGLNMYMPGAQHLSWPLYHSLRMLTEAKGYTHVSHEIPEGCYTVSDIYGENVLYEHGVKVSASEAALTKRMTERGAQVKKHITYVRIGDKHNVCRFSNDTKIVNGSFFGQCDDIGGGEYSAISGYNAEPAQITLFHTPRKEGDGRATVCDSLVVQLGHIKG